MTGFDYAAMAEVYSGWRSTRQRTLSYHRFETAAEALRFLIEDMPPDQLTGAILEIDEERFEASQITALYQDEAYPLARAGR